MTLKKKKKIVRAQNAPMAVIDIGTSAIRLLIAQPSKTDGVKTLESLQQSVSLGKDTFTNGLISMESTEACVKALRTFRKTILEYDITDDEQIRAVATSAVREAQNKDAFLDRIFIATGLLVDDLDEAEGNRYMYLSVYPLLEHSPLLKNRDALILEAGGGSTELVHVRQNNVAFSQTYRLGSLRLRETLEKAYKSQTRLMQLMDAQIQCDLNQIQRDVKLAPNTSLLILGGDARFAALQIFPAWDRLSPVQLDLSALRKLCEKFLQMSVDEIVKKYHLPYPDAESLAPALLIYTRLAEGLGMKKVTICGTSLRDGIMTEMTAQVQHHDEFRRQIIHSARELGRKYQINQEHAENISDTCMHLYQCMSRELYLSSRYDILLRVSAMLHEVGCFISERAHHKHSMYIIQHSEIFGLSARDKKLVSLIARYHRKAPPDPTHEGYADLNRRERIIVSKLAAILRVADAIQRTRNYKVSHISLELEPGLLIITIKHSADLSLEQIALAEKGQLFERIFGRKIIIRAGK